MSTAPSQRPDVGAFGLKLARASVLLWAVLAWCVGTSAVAAAPQWLGAPRPEGEVTRVVSLAPSLTETLLALGRGEVLVGVSNYDDDPRVAQLPRVGAADRVALEALTALRPHLVMAQPTAASRQQLRVLDSLGIPVLLLPTETMEETAASLRSAGRVVGAAAEGRRLAKTLEDTRAALREVTRDLPHRKVLLMVGREPLYVAGPGSYLDAMLRDVGGVNAARDASRPWSNYPLERAVASKPEVVLDGSGTRTLEKLPGLEGARWVLPPSSAMLRPGPSLVEGLRELAVLLHGEAILERLPVEVDAGATNSNERSKGTGSPEKKP